MGHDDRWSLLGDLGIGSKTWKIAFGKSDCDGDDLVKVPTLFFVRNWQIPQALPADAVTLPTGR
jgi:hypothetical protein